MDVAGVRFMGTFRGNTFHTQESIIVKQTRLTLFIVGLCLAFGFAAQASAQAIPHFVVVVDVAQLIKEHPEFATKQANLQAIVQAEETKFRARQQELQNREKAIANGPVKTGSPEHQASLEELANAYADFDKEAKAMQRKFAIENSKIMYETYRDIKAVIGKFAQDRKIAQVTDFRQFEVNPLVPETVAEDMDQKLVWFDPQLNMTELVIEEMYKVRGLPRPPKTAAGSAPTAQ